MRRILVLIAIGAIVACSPSDDGSGTAANESMDTTTTTTVSESTLTTMPRRFEVSSPAFADGAAIPAEFTCDGSDVNPPLDVVGIPDRTVSLVIIVDDPDAPMGVWDHWVEFDIDVEADSLQIRQDTEPLGAQGVNSWNLEGYMGPCPPAGDDPHAYHFTIYAIDGSLGLPDGVDSAAVRSAMEDKVIESVQLIGTFGR